MKQAIPHYYAIDAEKEFLALRKQKEEEWKSQPEEERARLREALDGIHKEIEKQQGMAACIRRDIEGASEIRNPELPVLDHDMQQKYEERVQKEMEEKLKEKIEADDEKRKWLLEEVNCLFVCNVTEQFHVAALFYNGSWYFSESLVNKIATWALL